MTAEESVRAGNLADALSDLQSRVRSQPGSAPLRVFLFQLLSVMGEWERALNQLNTAAELDPSSLAMKATYADAVQCEVVRAAVFAGKATPTIFGKPEPWMALLLEALRLDGEGKHEQAQSLRAQAFEAAPATPGKIEGTPFAWIADGDSRIGPMLEAVLKGRYVWIPLARLHQIKLEKPTDLRDLVWTPAELKFSNGGETVALIPTRYTGSEKGGNALAMARTTEWTQPATDTMFGSGQRVLITDAGEHPLLEVRLIEIDSPAEPAAEAASDADAPK